MWLYLSDQTLLDEKLANTTKTPIVITWASRYIKVAASLQSLSKSDLTAIDNAVVLHRFFT